MKTNPSPLQSSSTNEAKTAGMLVGGLALLVAFGWLLLPALEKGRADSSMEKMRPTLIQAEKRLVEHFADGDFSALDNEVLRQVAFPGMGRPVGPDQPLQIRGGLMDLSAIPVDAGKGFALIVDWAKEHECQALVSLYPDHPIQVNSRPVDRNSETTPCRPKRNEVRVDFTPPFNSASQPATTHVAQTH